VTTSSRLLHFGTPSSHGETDLCCDRAQHRRAASSNQIWFWSISELCDSDLDPLD
jgi:hypothetical protein